MLHSPTSSNEDAVSGARGVSTCRNPSRPEQERPLHGTVKFSGSVADWADETRHAELPGISIPSRNHQPRRLAVHRFGVSFRDVEDLLAQRGITVSYEAIRRGHGHWRVAPVRKRSFSPIVPTTRPIPARPLDALGSSSTAGRTRSAGQPSSHGITARPVASVADEAGVKRPLTARAAPVSRAHTVGRGPRKSADHADPAPRTS